MERDVLLALRDISAKHFCKYITVGQTDRLRFLIMPLIGKSLEDLKEASGHGTGRSKQFSLYTSLFVGIETLESIQELHKIGYLHRDLKPANFAVGRDPNLRRIYVHAGFRPVSKIPQGRRDASATSSLARVSRNSAVRFAGLPQGKRAVAPGRHVVVAVHDRGPDGGNAALGQSAIPKGNYALRHDEQDR